MMTYGCESWVLREREKTRLQATGMSVLIMEDRRSDQARLY